MSSSENISFEAIEKAIMDDSAITELVDDSNVDMKNSRGESLLFIAIRKGNLDTIEYLIFDCHADITDIRNGESALFVVCKDFSKRKKSLDIITLLLSYEAIYGNAREYINAYESNGLFPLFVASSNGATRIVELLLEKGAHANTVTNDGLNALSVAELNGHNDVVQLLLPVTSKRKSTVKKQVSPIVADALEIVDISSDDIPVTAYDFIYRADVNIADYLAESPSNKIIKVGKAYFAVCGDDLRHHYLSGDNVNNHLYYPCKRALRPPALGVSKNDVDMKKPLFSVGLLAGGFTDFVNLGDVELMLVSNHRYFEINMRDEFDVIPATATAQMFTANANAVGANHCQEGIPAKIFTMKILNVINRKRKVPEVIDLLSDSDDGDANLNRRSSNTRRISKLKNRSRVFNRKSANSKKFGRRRMSANRKSSVTKRRYVGRK